MFRLRSRGCRQPPLTADVWCSGVAGSPGRRRCAPRRAWRLLRGRDQWSVGRGSRRDDGIEDRSLEAVYPSRELGLVQTFADVVGIDLGLIRICAKRTFRRTASKRSRPARRCRRVRRTWCCRRASQRLGFDRRPLITLCRASLVPVQTKSLRSQPLYLVIECVHFLSASRGPWISSHRRRAVFPALSRQRVSVFRPWQTSYPSEMRSALS